MLLISMTIMMILLLSMLLIVHAGHKDGHDDSYGDNNENDNVASSCCYFHVTSQTLPSQKYRDLWALQTKSSGTDAKLRNKQRHPLY